MTENQGFGMADNQGLGTALDGDLDVNAMESVFPEPPASMAEPIEEAEHEETPAFIDVHGVQVPFVAPRKKWAILRCTGRASKAQAKKDFAGAMDMMGEAEDLAFGELADTVEAAVEDSLGDDTSLESFIGAIDQAIGLVISDGKNAEAKN